MDYLIYEKKGSIGYITLNMPDKLNALRQEMKDEFVGLLREIRYDKELRAVIITGAGRAFCAGGDVSTMGDKMHHNDGRERMRLRCDWARELFHLEKPVVAAVNGYAFGAGLSIALLSDFIICSEKGSFQASFINIGAIPDSGAAWVLPKRIGLGKAREICYTGRTVKAAEALEIGLADKVVPPEELMSAAEKLANKLANGPTYSIGLTKALINRTYENSFNNYLDQEVGYQAAAYQTADHCLAVKAFLEKTEKVYVGY